MSDSETRGPDETQQPAIPADLQGHSPTPFGKIGRYSLVRQLGRGGMGEVFEAVQTEPVRRKVALKLIKGGMDTQEVLARFDSERQALALMNHLNIARMLDGGATAEGRPYFVMEYIQGVPITEYCDSQALTNPERLELFIQVCAGVQHAHQKGIVHRDLKPSNVLVTIEDEKVIPKIIDFGLAKALGPADPDMTQYTHVGEVIGTPAYMSPEQVSGADIDTRTDVYSLGVLLYQLLVGAVPFDLKEIPQGGWDRFRKRICEQEPVRPSARIGSLAEDSEKNAQKRRIDPASWTKQLHGDLDWITLRALEKDRTRRYQSPAELAADITRHLNDEPILACPPSTVYRVRKFVRRHRIGVAAAAVVALALVAGITGTTVGLIRATKAEKAAVEESENTRQLADFLTGLFRVSDPSEARGNSVTAREILDQGARKIEGELKDRPVLRTEMMRTIGEVYSSLGLYAQAQPLLEESLAIARRGVGEKPLVLSRSLLQLASLYDKQARYKEALALAHESLRIREKALGPEHLEVASALLSIGITYRKSGNYPEATHALERAFAIREKALGPEHVEVLNTLYHMGWLYKLMGNYQRAAQCYQRILAVRENLGPGQPEVADALSDFGQVKVGMGDYAEALKLFERALEIRKKVLPPTHPKLASSLDSIGTLLWYMGKYHEARPFYERGLEVREKAFGPEHLELATSLNNLALLFRYLGEEQKSRPLYERALAITEKAVGSEHPETAQILINLAHLLSSMGEYKKPQLYYERALAIYEKKFEPGGFVANALHYLGNFHFKEHQYRKALPLLERSLTIQEKTLGNQHPDVAATLRNLAQLLGNSGNYEKSLMLYERALSIREKTGLPGPIAYALADIAKLHRANGRHKEARGAYERAVAIREKDLAVQEKAIGPEDPKLTASLMPLADLHGDYGNYEKARLLLQRALAIEEKAGSSEVQRTICKLADLHRNHGGYAAARPLYGRYLAMCEKRWGPRSQVFAEALVNLARLEVAEGRLSEADLIFKRATSIFQAIDAESPGFSYDQARYSALLKNRDKAIYFLKQAIARGFDAKHLIVHDPDFTCLHGEREYEIIIR